MRLALVVPSLLLALAAAPAGAAQGRRFHCDARDRAVSCATVACREARARQCAIAVADRRETWRQHRWALRKQLCREYGIRFTGSALCW